MNFVDSRIFIIVYSFILIGVCSVSVTMVVGKYFYSRELNVRLNPINEQKAFSFENKEYWLIGDSRFEQWQLPDSLIQNYGICNMGIGGETSSQVRYRLSSYFKRSKPKCVIVQVGINDLKAIGVFPKKEKQITEACISNIKQILDELIKQNVRPVFMTIIFPGNVSLLRKPFWNKKIRQATQKVNLEIIAYSQLNNIDIIDANAILANNDFYLFRGYQKNYLHINELGYNKLNDTIMDYLKIINSSSITK